MKRHRHSKKTLRSLAKAKRDKIRHQAKEPWTCPGCGTPRPAWPPVCLCGSIRPGVG